MFKLLKKLFTGKTELEKLEDQYMKLMEDSYRMSTIDRAKSDTLAYLANDVANQIDKLKSE